MAEKKTTTTPVAKFSRDQLLKSDTYARDRDLIKVLLNENKTYSHKQVEDALNDYKKGVIH